MPSLGVLLALPSWLLGFPTSIPEGNWGRGHEVLWVGREGAGHGGMEVTSRPGHPP